MAVVSLCAVGAAAAAYSATSDTATPDHRDDGLDFPALTELVPLTELPVLPELPRPTQVLADPDDGDATFSDSDDADSGDSDAADSDGADSDGADSDGTDSDGTDSDGTDSGGDDGDADDSDGSGRTDRDDDGDDTGTDTDRDGTGTDTGRDDTDAGRSSGPAADDGTALLGRADSEATLPGGYEKDASQSGPQPRDPAGAGPGDDVVPEAGDALDRDQIGVPAGPPPAADPPADAPPVADDPVPAPHRASVAVIAYTAGLPSPPEISWATGPVLQSLLLAPVMVILLAVAAGAVDGATRLPSTLARALEAAIAVRRRLTGAAAAAVAAVGGVLYAVLQPSFGFDGSSLALVVGMLLALVLGAAAQEGARLIYVDRWWGVRGRLVPDPGLVVLAVVSTLLSQAVRIEPGLLLGSLVAYRSARRLRTDEEGQAAAVSAACLAAVGLLAWSLRDPLVAAAGPTGAFLPEVLATTCTALPVLAAGNLVLATIPIATLAGGALLRWSRPLWVAFALAAAFALLHLVLRPGTDAGAFVGEGVLVTLLLVAYLLTVATVVAWSRAAHPPARTAHPREPIG